MKRRYTPMLVSFACLLAGPLLAQTQIGGGTCSSLSLNGPYAFNLTGRQVTATGTFTNVFLANGSATFDGESKVTLNMTTETLSSVGTPVAWSGTYSIQANCGAVVTVTSGGSAILNLGVYNQGKNFVVTGTDSTYVYNGNGDTQPATCSTATFSGVYAFTASGYNLTSAAVSGVGNGAGLLQFDGQGHLTVNVTLAGTTGSTALTGTYSATNCLGSATLSDSKGNSYVISWSAFTGSAVATTDFYVGFAQGSKVLLNGTAHAVYGQPAPTTSAALLLAAGRSRA